MAVDKIYEKKVASFKDRIQKEEQIIEIHTKKKETLQEDLKKLAIEHEKELVTNFITSANKEGVTLDKKDMDEFLAFLKEKKAAQEKETMQTDDLSDKEIPNKQEGKDDHTSQNIEPTEPTEKNHTAADELKPYTPEVPKVFQ